MRKRSEIAIAALAMCFLLGTKGDRLALWIEDDPEPAAVFGCRVSSLPPADQLLLRRGIRVCDPEVLSSLLEDYG